ncbi:putative cysteine desulfurase IscS [Candidatus Zinderia insecticola CARI]|uniref:cysteine desulfurase n=1 Tax=Zinderia insecticola (strain CARI) TaxID=871271 RepID=E0TIS4_ZINIC|nr:putative cysteine desulfurase IscS [Candidatus Zinderia insecticola CARI]
MKNNKFPIYLDYSATTPIDPRVVNKIIPILKYHFGNYSSNTHFYGKYIKILIEKSRKKISKIINCKYKEIIFTSGATESINLALKGILNFNNKKKNHIITLKTEHKATLNTLKELENLGYKITYLKPNKEGIINIKKLKKKINKKTILITIMYVNNEIGVIQKIKKISNLCNKKNIFLHCDATQAIGKININLKKTKIDLMSFSGHKIYAPKGIGVLYISKKSKIIIKPQIHGGGQERGIRSGTLATHQIIGLSKSIKILREEMKYEIIKIKILHNKLIKSLQSIEEIYINGNIKKKVPHILNINFNFIEGESLIMSLKNIAISSGSACTSSNLEPSYVIKSLNNKKKLPHSSIRFSIGRYTTLKEIKLLKIILKNKIIKLRNISPLWEMFKEGTNILKYKWKN